MATVTLKVPSLTNNEAADVVRAAIQRVKGVNDIKTDTTTHNVTVSYDDSLSGTHLTAIQVALQLSGHRHAAFAAGQRKRGFV